MVFVHSPISMDSVSLEGMREVSGNNAGRNQQAGGLTAIDPRHISERRAALPKGSKSGPIFSAKKVFLRARGFQRGLQSISGGGRPLFWGGAEKNRGVFEPLR